MIHKHETQAFRDQQADAIDRNPKMDCADEQCDTSANWKDIQASGQWQLSNDPDVPLLCPSCAEPGRELKKTPTELRKERNYGLNDGPWA